MIVEPVDEAKHPNSINYRQLYTSDVYELRNPGWHVSESGWKARAIASMLERNHLVPSSVCDVGCGVGGVMAELQRSLPERAVLRGYDISPSAISRAEKLENARLQFFLGDIQSAPKHHYDLLLVIDVLEHIEDYFSWLRGLRGIASHTIFHIPLDLTLHRLLRPRALTSIKFRYGHLHFFNRDLALQAIEDSGFKVVDWSYTEEFREPAGSESSARALRFPREALYRLSEDWAVRILGGCRLLVLAQ